MANGPNVFQMLLVIVNRTDRLERDDKSGEVGGAEDEVGDGQSDEADVRRALDDVHAALKSTARQHDQRQQVADHAEQRDGRRGHRVHRSLDRHVTSLRRRPDIRLRSDGVQLADRVDDQPQQRLARRDVISETGSSRVIHDDGATCSYRLYLR